MKRARTPPTNTSTTISPRRVYVIRTWRHAADHTWRGQLVLAASGLIISFESGSQLLAYLQTLVLETDDIPGHHGLK